MVFSGNCRKKVFFSGEKWPPREGEQAAWEGPDLLLVAFQEVQELNAVNVVYGGLAESVHAWDAAIRCALNQDPMPEAYRIGQVRQKLRYTLVVHSSHHNFSHHSSLSLSPSLSTL
jgi:hypothetical protein